MTDKQIVKQVLVNELNDAKRNMQSSKVVDLELALKAFNRLTQK